MNRSRLKRQLEETRTSARSWGRHLFMMDRLPIDHPFPNRNGTTRRQDLLDAAWHEMMFKTYLDTAEKAGMTTPA